MTKATVIELVDDTDPFGGIGVYDMLGGFSGELSYSTRKIGEIWFDRELSDVEINEVIARLHERFTWKDRHLNCRAYTATRSVITTRHNG